MNDDLSQFLTPRRLERINQVLANRTRNLTLLVEGIFDPHNIAACMRTSEGLGLQEIHVVTKGSCFKPHHKVVNGAGKWMDIGTYEEPELAVAELKRRGFKIYAGALMENARPIQELDFRGPVAMAFGNEHEGLTRTIIEAADECFIIPMLGFTQSFNISVAASICLYHAVEARKAAFGPGGDLSEDQLEALRRKWIELSVPRGDMVRTELLSRITRSKNRKKNAKPDTPYKILETGFRK